MFLDEQPLGDISRGEGEMNLSRIDLISNNVRLDVQTPGDISRSRSGMNLSRINLTSENGNAPSVVACGQGTMSGPSPARLIAPQVLHHSDAPDQRSMESEFADTWMAAMKARQNSVKEQLGKLQDSVMTLTITMQGAESLYRDLQETIEDLKSNSSEVWQRLATDERRLDVQDKAISTVEYKVDNNLETVREWFVDLTAQSSPEIPREIVNSIQDVINDSSPGIAVDRMRDEIREIRQSLETGRHVTEGLRGLVVNLSDQVSNKSIPQVIQDDSLMFRDHNSGEITQRECEIVRKGIERTEKQLRQLILNDLSTESVDISLVWKYKTVDVPCVHSAIGNIQKALQKYVKFYGMNFNYCDSINELLDNAENWCLRVEELYNKAEIHSINTLKGDTADVGVFSDNAKVTVYEFLEAAEIAYLGWGNSVQKANRLYNRHLSEEIKGKLINKSDSYAKMKYWLIQNYGGVSRIVNDIINDLSRRSKPEPNNSNAKFSFYAYISGALQRLERLSKVKGIDMLDLENCLYSRAMLSSLSLILPAESYSEWISEMTKSGMDYKNPVGTAAYSVWKDLCIIERNKSEGSRQPEKVSSPKMKPRSPRLKPKTAHMVMETTEDDLDEIQDGGVFATSYHNTKWYSPNLKFPCPLRNHKHKVSSCPEFFSFSPAERWNKMDKGKLCYACLAPKDVCTGRKCNFEDKVPETLKCQGCIPNAQSCSAELKIMPKYVPPSPI